MDRDRSTVFVGIDPAAESFAAALLRHPAEAVLTQASLANSIEGWAALCQWLSNQGALPDQTIICIENTGVYNEQLCYYLHQHGYRIAVEAVKNIKRAADAPRKNDLVDAQQIAQYAWRFADKLIPWQPNDVVVEQVSVLLSTREQFTQQLTANHNALKSIERKYVDTPKARLLYQQTIAYLKQQIAEIDRELKELITKHPSIGPLVTLLVSAPGVSLLLAANLLVITNGFQRALNGRSLACYIGICPHEYTSGTSVRRRPRSRGYGPARIRKLLYLAAMSLRTHNERFRQYFLRKVAEGKPKRLVLNNIANRLLRILMAMINTRMPFIETFRSINPALLA